MELANTLYVDGDEVVDFLATPGLAAGWLSFAPEAAALGPPQVLHAAQVTRLCALRDTVHRVLAALVGDARTSARQDITDRDLAMLNHVAAAAQCRLRIERDHDGGLRSTLHYSGGRFDVLLARLAAGSIEFLCSPDRSLVQRCAHPDCAMFFVPRHHRRRFCHESCAHRARQARYYAATAGAARRRADRRRDHTHG